MTSEKHPTRLHKTLLPMAPSFFMISGSVNFVSNKKWINNSIKTFVVHYLSIHFVECGNCILLTQSRSIQRAFAWCTLIVPWPWSGTWLEHIRQPITRFTQSRNVSRGLGVKMSQMCGYAAAPLHGPISSAWSSRYLKILFLEHVNKVLLRSFR